MYSESFAPRTQSSQLLNYLKAVGFAAIYVAVVRILLWIFPLDNILYGLNITVAPAFSFLHLIGIFASGLTSAIIVASIFFLTLFAYIWIVVSRFFSTAKMVAAINILVTVIILNTLIPSPARGGWEVDQPSANSAVAILEQQYYPKGSTIPNDSAASSMDESAIGALMVRVQFRNNTNRSLELTTMTAENDPYSHLVGCRTESNGSEVAVGQVQESTHWCTLIDPEWFDKVSSTANTEDLPWWQKLLMAVLMQQASSSVPKNVIVDGEPLKLLLNFETNATTEEAKAGNLPTESYQFETTAQDWKN